MRNMTRLAAATLLFGLVALPAAAQTTKSPVGAWQSTDGQARVSVTMCGDGSQLCAKLTALAGEARTPENLQLLNRYVVDRAQPAEEDNSWQGILHFNGTTATGNIVLQGADTISVSGCEMGMCKTLLFKRI